KNTPPALSRTLPNLRGELGTGVLHLNAKLYIKKVIRNLSYGIGVLAILLLLASIFALIWGSADIRKYATVTLTLGYGWLILPLVWIGRYHFGKKFLNSNYWLAGWLIPAWLALAVAGSNGFLSDYNPQMRTFLAQPAI
ncbi:phospholipid carrier-dependent glycosyltransferase, partial [Fischerella thermalis CCMEE 5282]